MTRKNGLLQFPVAAGASYAIDTVVTGTADADGDGFDTAAEWLAGRRPALPSRKAPCLIPCRPVVRTMASTAS